MLAAHLRALASLPFRPRRAMCGLLDNGGILTSLLLAAIASAVLWYGLGAGVLGAFRASAVTPQTAAPSANGPVPGATTMAQPPTPMWPLMMAMSGFGPIATVAGLVFLYVPATLLLVTFFDRVGSFTVALRRDFGGLLVCSLSAFTVAFVPVGLVGLLAAVPLPVLLGLLGIGVLAFAALMVVAVQTASGANLVPALAAVGLSWLSFALQSLVLFIASPCILYYGYCALRGDIVDIRGGLGARRSFRRYLEASTLNPRDADAHYQLGLIHLQRRQLPEAAERFRRAVEIDPAEIDAHLQLARIARQEGRWPEAIQHLEAVLSRDPAHSAYEAWREAGAVYLATGAFANARTVLERFVENRPYDAEGLCRLGTAHKGLGDAATARDLFGRAVDAARTAPDHRQREVRPWGREARRELRSL